jgi:hypothetical protein
MTELVTTFFSGYSDLTRHLSALFNREDLEDHKEDIFVGSVLIVHARSGAGFHP